jgi:cytochrome P450
VPIISGAVGELASTPFDGLRSKYAEWIGARDLIYDPEAACYLICAYDDATHVLSSPALFGSRLGVSASGHEAGAPLAVTTDPPDHLSRRRGIDALVRRCFGSRTLWTRHEDRARRRLQKVVSATEPIEIISGLCAPLVIELFLDGLGSSGRLRDTLEESLMGLHELGETQLGGPAADLALGRVNAVVRRLVRRESSLVAHILQSAPGERQSDVREASWRVSELLIAGLETLVILTAEVIDQHVGAGDGADRSSRESAHVQDIVRLSSPTQYVARTATCGGTLRDTRIVGGDRLLVVIAAANFQLSRTMAAGGSPGHGPRTGLAFGAGPHRCPGRGIAIRHAEVVARALGTTFVRGAVVDRSYRNFGNTYGLGKLYLRRAS